MFGGIQSLRDGIHLNLIFDIRQLIIRKVPSCQIDRASVYPVFLRIKSLKDHISDIVLLVVRQVRFARDICLIFLKLFFVRIHYEYILVAVHPKDLKFGIVETDVSVFSELSAVDLTETLVI